MLIFKNGCLYMYIEKFNKNNPHTFFDEMDDEMILGSEDLF